MVTASGRDGREGRAGTEKNGGAKKGLTRSLKDRCLKTLFSTESVILGVPKFGHAPNPPGGLGAPFHIFRDGLDVADERRNPGPGFKRCEGEAGFVLCVPLPGQLLGLFLLFDLLSHFLQDGAEEPGHFLHFWLVFSNELPEPASTVRAQL